MSSRFPLLKHAFGASTRKSYKSGVKHFLGWSGFSLNELTDVISEDGGNQSRLDTLMCTYVHYVNERFAGRCKHRAEGAYYGLPGLIAPNLKGKLPLTAAALRGWRKVWRKKQKARNPLLQAPVCALVKRLWRDKEYVAGAAILFSFAGFLRIKEAVKLKIRHAVTENTAGSDKSQVGFRIRKAKTGPYQFARIREPQFVRLLQVWKNLRLRQEFGNSSGRLLPISRARLRKCFKEGLHKLGVTTHFVFHSLRHGAATQARLDGMSVPKVMELGRWAAHKSAHTYINRAKQFGLKPLVPERVQRMGDHTMSSGELERIMAQISERF